MKHLIPAAPAVASPARTLAMSAPLNRCILINLHQSAPDEAGKRWRIPTYERAGTLIDLKECVAMVPGATLDLDPKNLLFPKVFVNDALADHRALRDTLREYAKQAELVVLGA